MNKLKQLVLEHKMYIFAVIILAIILYLPMLISPAFSMLNDGWYIHMSKEVGFFDFEKLATFHTNRLIPFTLIFSDAILTLARHTAVGLVYIYFLEIIVVGLCLYHLLHRLCHSKKISLFGTAFIFFSAAFVTNVYEFFTQDHISFLLLLIFCVLYFAAASSQNYSVLKKIFILGFSLLSLVFFIITKETNIFMVGVFAGLLVYDYLAKAAAFIKRLDALYLLVSGIFLAVVILERSQFQSTASGYSIANIPSALIAYTKLLHFNILIALYALSVLILKFKKSGWNLSNSFSREHLFYILVALGGFLVYLPWGSHADRYMLITLGFIYLFFFSYIKIDKSKKLLLALLTITILANLFFVAFHAVRFYGARQGDNKLLIYLKEHADEYDQICVQSAAASPEDALQLSMWINKIFMLNKSVCSLSSIESAGHRAYFDAEGILYNEKVALTERTLFVGKDHSFVPTMPIDKKYEVTVEKVLETHLPNIHPTRGFEIKKFDWKIGSVHYAERVTKI